MDMLANCQMMTLLYGSPTTYCYECRAYLTDPEKAHPRQHPARPFQTVALCDACNSGTGPLRIREPKLQTCLRCEQDFLPRTGGRLIFCSEACATTHESQPQPELKRVESRKSCGPCDCEDYHTLGYCTMVATNPETQQEPDGSTLFQMALEEDPKRILFEPKPKTPVRLLG